MNQEEIIKRLKEGNKFTGRNGVFTGIVTPLIYADKANMLVVECERMDVNFKMIGFYYILFGDSKTEIMYLFKTNKI